MATTHKIVSSLVLGLLLSTPGYSSEREAKATASIDAKDIIGAPDIGIKMYEDAIRRGWHLSPAGSTPRDFLEPVASYIEGKYFLSYPALYDDNAKELKKIMREPGYQIYARTIQDVLGMRFDLASTTPIEVIACDLESAGFSDDAELGIAHILSIRLEAPTHEVSFPSKGTLTVKITGHHKKDPVEIDVSMHETGPGIYVISGPDEAFREIATARTEFFNEEKSIPTHDMRPGIKYPRWPELVFDSFSGLELDHDTIKDMPPAGVLLIHHVYLGKFRLVTGYQWAGRPAGLPGSQQVGFVRSEN